MIHWRKMFFLNYIYYFFITYFNLLFFYYLSNQNVELTETLPRDFPCLFGILVGIFMNHTIYFLNLTSQDYTTYNKVTRGYVRIHSFSVFKLSGIPRYPFQKLELQPR